MGLRLNLDAFVSYIPSSVDIRPYVGRAVQRHIKLKPLKRIYDAHSPAAAFFKTVVREVGIKTIDFGMRANGVDPAPSIIHGWNKNEKNKSKRGHPRLAEAVFYWFFRFSEDASYFTSIAKETWRDDGKLCRRFCYAKEGGQENEPFDAKLLRFASEEALSHKVILASEPLQPGSMAVFTEADAEKALRDIVRIELSRDQGSVRNELSDIDRADRQNRIDALSSYVERVSDTTALAPWLTSLFAVKSWTDAEAYRRRDAYGTLGSEFFKKMDLSRSHSLKMGMELAHVFQVNGNHRDGDWVLARLPDLDELPDDPMITQAFLRRADTIYPNRDLGASAMADFIGDRFGRKCSREGASMWRCAACAALKMKQYEKALACVEESRRHLHVMPSSMEERLIPYYLRMIEVIANINIQSSTRGIEDSIKIFEEILCSVKEITDDYEPFLIGVRSEIIKLRLRRAPRKAHDVEQNTNSILRLRSDVENTIGSQIRVMCFFDFDEIEQEVFGFR